MKLAILGIFMVVTASVLLFSKVTLAQDPLDGVCQQNPNATICQNRSSQNPILGPNGIITRVVQIIVMITGIASVIMITVGGFKYTISTGDSSNINSAKNTILYAVIGLVIAIFGQAIVSFVLSRL